MRRFILRIAAPIDIAAPPVVTVLLAYMVSCCPPLGRLDVNMAVDV
jgi:hypothetical protein